MFDGPLNWGDVPSWITAFATLALVGAGAVPLYRVGRERIRSQAEQVYVWTDRFSMGGDPEVDELVDECEVVVANASSGPVFDVNLRLLNLRWADDAELIDGCVFFGIPPDSRTNKVTLGELSWGDFIRDSPDSLRWPLEIEFTDAAGRRWYRDPDGRLHSGPRKPSLTDASTQHPSGGAP